MAEPGLNHLGIQVGGDQRRGVEVPKVVEPRSLREAVCRVGACLAALSAFERLYGPVTADAGISDGQAPAVTEGVPPCDLAEPIGDDNFAWSAAKALDVRKQAISSKPTSSSLAPTPTRDAVHQALGREGTQDPRDRGLGHAVMLREGRRGG